MMKKVPDRSPTATLRTPAARARGTQSRELRIIAGCWRGKRWRFPDLGSAAADLRPTPDRVRETLFNWLQQHIAGARCLDLFAGSGALGLEALSRGAASVAFVETDQRVARAISAVLAAWGAQQATVATQPAAQYLARGAPGGLPALDLVFLDPPFAAGLLESAAAALDNGRWLADGALIYVEHARSDSLPRLPAAWQALKTGNAGAVSYHLYRHRQPA
jgi:16S rRNA (guanine966-N2)-methyltransferase